VITKASKQPLRRDGGAANGRHRPLTRRKKGADGVCRLWSAGLQYGLYLQTLRALRPWRCCALVQVISGKLERAQTAVAGQTIAAADNEMSAQLGRCG